MLKKLLISVLLAFNVSLIYSFIVNYPVSQPRPADKTQCTTNPPRYIFPLVNLKNSTVSNAVIIDNKAGLLIAMAHAVINGNAEISDELFIQAETSPPFFLAADTKEGWVDRHNDLAIIKTHLAAANLPAENGLLPSDVAIGEYVAATGFIPYLDEAAGVENLFYSYCINAKVIKTNAGACIYPILLRCTRWYLFNFYKLAGWEWPKNETARISNNYTHISRYAGNQDFRGGMSGSPATNESGKIIGFISGITRAQAILSSAASAEKLLIKVKDELNSDKK